MQCPSIVRLPFLALLVFSVTGCSDDSKDSAEIVDTTPDGDTGAEPDTSFDSDANSEDAESDSAADADTEPDASSEDVEPDVDLGPPPVRDPAPEHAGIYGFAHGCYRIEAWAGRSEARFATVDSQGDSFEFSAEDDSSAARFRLQPSDLGTYLLFDAEREYLVAGTLGDGSEAASNGPFGRVSTLSSDVTLLDDSFRSPAEWSVEVSPTDNARFRLRHYQTGEFLGLDGLTADEETAAVITFHVDEGCAEFPELSIDATGEVVPRQWEDGSVYGIAELHTHLMTNFGFGGGGMFHGAPFHRLGVEHAVGSCEQFHGEGGRRDLIGSFYDGDTELDIIALLPLITSGQREEFQHATEGYPEFTDWPNAWARSTHQVAYYRWLERAYLSGLRLLVQHATGNSALCDFMTGIGSQTVRYSCNDMFSVDRSIEEVRNMERYIDAQSGGPGEGWFRVVETPEEARAVINDGKLAVILGIEISNLFDCFLTPPEGFEPCTAETVRSELDHYFELGVRVVFPVHKFDNAFSPGDGAAGVIEIGNLINSGHYTNMVEDCPESLSDTDSRRLTFGGLNRPREEYLSPPPVDMSEFADGPLASLLPLAEELTEGSTSGEFCQNAGLTELGETLLSEMMMRGMIADLAHLPQWSAAQSLEMLAAEEYPATSTHGSTFDGEVYDIGGMSPRGFGGCASPDQERTMVRRVLDRAQQRADAGFERSEGLSFDFNGFAGSRRPRFGENSGCTQPQPNPVEYPFTSYDGQVEFTEPQLGNRSVDFNTEGLIHFGLLPELIEDARRDGATDDDLEPLFRSAETYIRMWERAEARGAALRGE